MGYITNGVKREIESISKSIDALDDAVYEEIFVEEVEGIKLQLDSILETVRDLEEVYTDLVMEYEQLWREHN